MEKKNYKKYKAIISAIGVKDISNLLAFLRALPPEHKEGRVFEEMIEPFEFVEQNTRTEKKCPECGARVFLSDFRKCDLYCVNCDQCYVERSGETTKAKI